MEHTDIIERWVFLFQLGCIAPSSRVAGVREKEAEVLHVPGTCLHLSTVRTAPGISYRTLPIMWSISPVQAFQAPWFPQGSAQTSCHAALFGQSVPYAQWNKLQQMLIFKIQLLNSSLWQITPALLLFLQLLTTDWTSYFLGLPSFSTDIFTGSGTSDLSRSDGEKIIWTFSCFLGPRMSEPRKYECTCHAVQALRLAGLPHKELEPRNPIAVSAM